MKKFKKYILILCILIAIAIRMSTISINSLIGADSGFFYEMALSYKEYGAIPYFFTYPPFLSILLANLSYFFPMFTLARFWPVLMAVAIVTVTYYLTEKIHDEDTALISALFVGIFPFFVFRTTLGLFDNDSLTLLLAIINLLAYVNFSTKKNDFPWILVGILSAISLVYTWRGAFIYISIFAIFSFYYEINKDRLFYVFCVSTVFIILSYATQYKYVNYSLLSGTLAISLGLGKYVLVSYPKYEKAAYLTGMLLLSFMFLLFSRTGVSAWEATTVKIVELSPMGIERAWERLSLFILLFPVGFIQSLRNEKYALPAWSIFFFFALSYVRGLIFSLVPIAILSAYSITSTLKNINYRGIAAVCIALMVLFLTYPIVSTSMMLYMDSLSDAMKFLRENTEEDSVVLANWDYGQTISGIGQRKSVVAHSGKLAQDIAEILFSPYTNSSKSKLENLGTDYVMVDSALAVGKYRGYEYINETEIFFYEYFTSGGREDSIFYGKNEISFNTRTNKAYLHVNNRKIGVSDVIVKTRKGNKIHSYEGGYRGAVFVSKDLAMLISPSAKNTLYARLFFYEREKDFKKVFDNDFYKIFSFNNTKPRITDIKTDRIKYSQEDLINAYISTKEWNDSSSLNIIDYNTEEIVKTLNSKGNFQFRLPKGRYWLEGVLEKDGELIDRKRSWQIVVH